MKSSRQTNTKSLFKKYDHQIHDDHFSAADNLREREDAISKDATDKIRDKLSGEMPEIPRNSSLSILTGSAFRRQRTQEAIMTDGQTEQMEQALKGYLKSLAKIRVERARRGIPIDDAVALPHLHKAQKMTFRDREVLIHLGSRGAPGTNVVALPKISQTGESTLKMARGANILTLQMTKDGRQEVLVDNSVVKGSKNLRVKLCFSDQRENLRKKSREDTRS